MVRSLPFAAAHLHPAVIVPVQARNVDELVAMVARAHTSPGIDVLEWRVDALDGLAAVQADDAETSAGCAAWSRVLDEVLECARLLSRFTIPVLATVRTAAEGGPVALGEDRYAELVAELISARPAAVDVEYLRRDSARLLALARESGVAGVASFHDFAATPTAERLTALVVEMEAAGADVAKFAVTPAAMSDVLRVLEVGARAVGVYADGDDGADGAGGLVQIPVIAIAMGRLGQITRIAGEFGSAATFAALESGSAPGQLSVADTLETFRARGLCD